MRIEDQFRVNVPIERAWAVLLDVERIAPCLPGAQLQEIEGDEFRGVVKVKVGPITAAYQGTAKLDAVDEAARTIRIRGVGRDTRGAGNATAIINVGMHEVAGGTEVSIDTDLAITGKVAQFGRGVLADVSAKILAQFVENLERDVLGDEAAVSAPSEVDVEVDLVGAERAAAGTPDDGRTAGVSELRIIDGPEAEPVDLIDNAGGALARRAVPPVLVLLAIFLVWRLLRRSRRHPEDEIAGELLGLADFLE